MTQAATHASGHDHDHDHSHEEGAFECCSHHELEIDRYILLYLGGGVLAMVSWIASKSGVNEQIAILPAVLGS